MVTLVGSEAKSRVDQPGSDRIKRAIFPQAVLPSREAMGAAALDTSRASSLRGGSSARRISIVPREHGPRGRSRPLSRMDARPETDSNRSQSDSLPVFSAGHPKRRVKRSLRAEPQPAGRGRVIRCGLGFGESRSIDSQPLRRRIRCSDMHAVLNGPLAGCPESFRLSYPPRDDDEPGRPGSQRIKKALLWPSFR
jgi:hypothetical protein